MLIRGLSAFPLTPADTNGHVDVSGVRRLVGRLRNASVGSIGLLGSTGTYAYLSRAERRRAVDAALEEAGTGLPVVVGVGALRTDDAVALAQDAKAAGAAAGLLAPVSYAPLNEEEVYEHFQSVVRESNLPLCIYDNPSTTHFTFSTGLIARLAKLPNVVAVKCPAPREEAASHLSALRAAVPDTFSVGYSVDWTAVEALIAGADAWYSVVGGLFPAKAMLLTQTAQSGSAEEARSKNAELQPLWDLFQELSSLRVMYASATILGLVTTAPPRPILPLPQSAHERVAGVLEALNLS